MRVCVGGGHEIERRQDAGGEERGKDRERRDSERLLSLLKERWYVAHCSKSIS